MDSESESKVNEYHITQSEYDSSNLSSDDIYSESDESEDNDISSVRMWVEEKTVCSALPLFNFIKNAGIVVGNDSLIQYFKYFSTILCFN